MVDKTHWIRNTETGNRDTGSDRTDLELSERDPLLDLGLGLSIRAKETRVGGKGSD